MDNVPEDADQDLFSHPYTYERPEQDESTVGKRVSRDNLFREPADPDRPEEQAQAAPEPQAAQPPRDPFAPPAPTTVD